jgi:NAD(P) transhydrogenase subunit alpha
MAVKIGVPKENRPNERRVALVPTVAAKLKKLGAELALEAGAGGAALIPDEAYAKAGVSVGPASC